MADSNKSMKMAWRTGHYDFRYHFKPPKGGNDVKVMLFVDGEFYLICPVCGRAAHRHPTLPPDAGGYYRATCPKRVPA